MKLKKLGFALAVFYGYFSLVVTLFSVIIFSVPSEAFFHYLGVMVAVPFMVYPFWWMIVSFIGGIIFTYFLMKEEAK